MKKIVISIVAIFIFIYFGLIFNIIRKSVIKHKYCGTIVHLYETPAGYKVYPEKHVVFYCDSLKRNVDVNVTNQCYCNSWVNKDVCFELSQEKLEQ